MLPFYDIPPANKHEALSRIKELLSKPENWFKGAFAVDEKGTPVHYDSRYACKICLNGAVFRSGGGAALEDLVIRILHEWPPDFNDRDTTTFEDLQNLLNKVEMLCMD